MSDPKQLPALVDRLAFDLQPIGWATVWRRVLGTLGICALASLAAVLWLWGVRPDIAAALPTMAFWAKESFAAALALAGVTAMLRLARPDGRARGPARLAFGAAMIMALLAILQLGMNPGDLWRHLVMVKTAAVCP